MKKTIHNGKQYNLTEESNGVITLTPAEEEKKRSFRPLYQTSDLILSTGSVYDNEAECVSRGRTAVPYGWKFLGAVEVINSDEPKVYNFFNVVQ